MKRGRILIIGGLFASIALHVSCDDWLDVTPQAQINAEKLFATPDGYESALYGIYTELTDPAVYGEHMTFGLMDVLAQYYDIVGNKYHEMYDAANYNYKASAIQDIISDLWLKSYNAIANCNVLLKYLQQRSPDFFAEGRYDLIYAETIALRAWLHFDLLRAFAPSWKQDKDALCLPYADNFTDKIHRQRKTSEVVELIITDLEKAREILKDMDWAVKDHFKDMYNHYINDKTDVFASARAYRMNYWAVTGLLARVYHYMGDPEALDYANEVIQAKEDGFFSFTSENSLSAPEKSRDVVMQNEILFALNYPGVHKLWYSIDAGASPYVIGDPNGLYPSSDDFRFLYLVVSNSSSSNKKVSIKYADVKSEYGGKVPIIRMSEMYLIAAEAGFQNDKERAIALLEELKQNRGVGESLSRDISFEEFRQEVVKEARREFLGEGQMFFWYKRLGLPVDKGGGAVIELEPDLYCLPLPSHEVEFGGRAEDYITNLTK